MYSDLGLYFHAKIDLTDALRVDPNNLELLMFSANISCQLNDPEEAFKIISKICNIYPRQFKKTNDIVERDIRPESVLTSEISNCENTNREQNLLKLLSDTARKWSEDTNKFYEIKEHGSLRKSRLMKHFRSGKGQPRFCDNIIYILQQDMKERKILFGDSLVSHIQERVKPIATLSKGMGLVARNDYHSNDIIFIENPIVSFCDDMNNRCSYCHQRIEKERTVVCKCSEKYCCEECKNSANFEYHSILCGTEYHLLEQKIMELGTCQSPSLLRNFCLIIKLIAMAAQQGMDSPLDLPCLQALRRSTDLDSPPRSMDDQLTSEQPISIYIAIGALFRQHFEKLTLKIQEYGLKN